MLMILLLPVLFGVSFSPPSIYLWTGKGYGKNNETE